MKWDRQLLTPVFSVLLLAAACGGKSSPGVVPDAGSDAGGEPAGLTKCERPNDCVVIAQSCCGSCGAATRGDARALNRDALATWKRPECQDTGCPACYRVPDPSLLATCEAKTCRLVDLLEHVASACTSDSDCRIRTSSCCECGGDTSVGHLVAVSDEASYAALVCSIDQACPECAPIYPSEPRATCSSGHCKVEDPRLP